MENKAQGTICAVLGAGLKLSFQWGANENDERNVCIVLLKDAERDLNP